MAEFKDVAVYALFWKEPEFVTSTTKIKKIGITKSKTTEYLFIPIKKIYKLINIDFKTI